MQAHVRAGAAAHSVPSDNRDAALLGFVVESDTKLRLRTAEIAAMRTVYLAVLVYFRVRFAELAYVPPGVCELADLDDIKQTFSVFGLVYIIIRNIKSGDMELLFVRGDFFEQLREALATGGFKLPATLTGHLDTHAHIIAEAVPHDPYATAVMRLLVAVMPGTLQPAAGRSQTEEVFDLLDRHAIVQREREPVNQDDVVSHFQPPELEI